MVFTGFRPLKKNDQKDMKLKTTNLSYRFPIFETSATALCGTTGKIPCHFPIETPWDSKDPPGQRPSLSVPWRRLVAQPELLRCRLVAYEEPVERLVLSAMDTLKGRKLEDAGTFMQDFPWIFLWKSWIFLWFSMEFPENHGFPYDFPWSFRKIMGIYRLDGFSMIFRKGF